MSTLFVKATLSFPSYQLLWLFKEQTQAINIHIEPKKNTITGLFAQNDIDKAIEQFHAVTVRVA